MSDPNGFPRYKQLLPVIALAALLAGTDFGAPVLAQQGRPAAQQNTEAPRGNAPSAEPGARPARPQNDNAQRLPADSTTDHAIELPGRQFVLGVQWHPEADEASPVIGALVGQARESRGARSSAAAGSARV